MDTKNILSLRSQRDFIHDLSSPLTIALGMVESALRDSPPDTSEKLAKAKKALDKLTGLLRDRRSKLMEHSGDDGEV